MELYIAIAVVVVVGGYFIYKEFKRADKNGDGKIDATEAAAVREEVKVVVQEAKTQVKTAAKKAAVKAKATTSRVSKAAVRKSSGKKPAPKK